MCLSPSTLSLFHHPSLAHSHSFSPFLSLTMPAISRSNLFSLFLSLNSCFSLLLSLSLFQLISPHSLFSLPLPIICFLLSHIPLPIICHFSLSLTLPLSLMSFPLSDSSPTIPVLSHSQLSQISNSLSFPLISTPSLFSLRLPIICFLLSHIPLHFCCFSLSLSDSISHFNVFPSL